VSFEITNCLPHRDRAFSAQPLRLSEARCIGFQKLEWGLHYQLLFQENSLSNSYHDEAFPFLRYAKTTQIQQLRVNRITLSFKAFGQHLGMGLFLSLSVFLERKREALNILNQQKLGLDDANDRQVIDFGILKWPSLAFCFGPPQANHPVL